MIEWVIANSEGLPTAKDEFIMHKDRRIEI
jgi:hypothetical protein